MNMIWDVMLSALSQGIPSEQLHFVVDSSPSPYLEVAFEEMNADSLYDNTIEVNPLYRFTGIFAKALDINVESYAKLREILLDAFIHHQSRLDLRSGLTKSEFYVRAILKDILGGAYGKKAAENAQLFTNLEMKSILYGMLDLFKSGASLELFRKIMRSIYPDVLIYLNKGIYREILLYMPQDKTESELKKLDFLVSMFLSINYTVFVFWKHHFGVIGINESLYYDDMLIF